jgi:glyoxylase-like metal-dependent hydrolase (beta-lactamase superfamily II)
VTLGVADAFVLADGYLSGPDDDRVGSTVGFIRDGDVRIVVDPGLVRSPAAILGPLRAHGVEADDVTDVVLSHHHPDHTLKAALFANARVHDHWAWYRDDRWVSRPAEGFQLSPGVRLTETPGHSPQDISTLVETDEGLVVFTHLWWTSEHPAEDPYATDPAALHEHRARILELPDLVRIVPGHGAPFTPGPQTPR